MKFIEPAALAALENSEALVFGAVEFHVSPTPVYVFGGYGTLTIDGKTFEGIGANATVAPTSFEMGGAETGVTLRLPGVDQTVTALIAAEQLRGVPCVIWRCIADKDGVNLLGANVFFRGRVDQTPLSDTIGGASEARIDVEGSARGLNRSGARLANLADQKLVDASDTSFERIATVGGITLYWLGEAPKRASAAVNGGSVKFFGMPVDLTRPKLFDGF